MPRHTGPPFDPLRHLREDLRAEVWLDEAGQVAARLPRDYQSGQQRRRVQWTLDHYAPLIALQLERGGASVQKLIAQGHLVLREGRYVRR